MSEQIKFTQDELSAISAVQQKFNTVTFKLGQLIVQKHALEVNLLQNELDFDTTKKELGSITQEEKKLTSLFESKYGQGQLDPQTGVFTPAPKSL